jgi:hypothetical protein
MEAVSLQNLIKDVADQVMELSTGTTTSNSASVVTANDGNFATYQGLANWQGSQFVFEEPASTSAGNINPGPHFVSSYSSGVWAVNLAFRSSGVVPAGLNYFVIRPGGRGKPYSAYLRALNYALDRLNVQADMRDSTLTTATNTWEYTIPAGFAAISDVVLTKTGYMDQLLRAGLDWDMRPGRKLWLKNQYVTVDFGWGLSLYGIAESTLPATLDATVYCPRADVADLAAEYLQRNSPRPQDNQRGGARQQERLRFGTMLPRPNLRWVMP